MPRTFLYLSLLFLFFACHSNKVSRSSIKQAQKLNGLSFESDQIKTMQDYINRNRAGYDSMRTQPLASDVAPALIFDPHPIGFKLPDAPDVFEIQLPSEVERPDNMDELAYYSIPQLAHLIKTEQVSCVELTEFFLKRIEKYDPQLEAVITQTTERALKQARQLDRELGEGNYRGLLHGIPYGTKDLMAVEGYKTTWGAAPYKDQVIENTATVIEKLDAAGAVLIAKLVSGALARGDVWFGGKTRNPWDLEQGASGSSAGSGSATSAGLVPFALGTETLGSITSPATRNGVTGLRPTYGTVSREGVMSLSWSMDKVGPLCRNAQDCAIVYDAIRGKDEADPLSANAPFRYSEEGILSDLKVGYFKSLFDNDTSAGADNGRAMLTKLETMGVTLDSAELPKILPYPAYDIILRAEAGAFFDELVRTGGDKLLVEQEERSRANSLRQSRFIPAVEYLQANRHRRAMIEMFNKIISQYDVIVTPTFGGTQLLMTNLTGHPVVCIPAGFDKEGHPTSISFLGNLYDEGKILELANAVQQATDFHSKHPPQFK